MSCKINRKELRRRKKATERIKDDIDGALYLNENGWPPCGDVERIVDYLGSNAEKYVLNRGETDYLIAFASSIYKSNLVFINLICGLPCAFLVFVMIYNGEFNLPCFFGIAFLLVFILWGHSKQKAVYSYGETVENGEYTAYKIPISRKMDYAIIDADTTGYARYIQSKELLLRFVAAEGIGKASDYFEYDSLAVGEDALIVLLEKNGKKRLHIFGFGVITGELMK